MPKRFKKENSTGENRKPGAEKGPAKNVGKRKEEGFPKKYKDKNQPQRKEGYPKRQERSSSSSSIPNYEKALASSPKGNLLQKGAGQDDLIRLNRYIANAGICSRREADNLIAQGDITVNDKVITSLGHKIKKGDTVKYKGKVLKREKMVYVLLNKPKGYITTTHDPDDRK